MDFCISRLVIISLVFLGSVFPLPSIKASKDYHSLHIRLESKNQSAQRHAKVAERRKRVHIICHRGASEFAHENTLEAYRATFEMGGDGNEFDIRKTKDGVLVLFHDDMLDQILRAFGDVSDYTWKELQKFHFREPGRFGKHCRIPTLIEVFDLHRRYAGLMHLDIKQPGLDQAIAKLLDQMDMWDHVAHCNQQNSGIILKHTKLRLLRYKAALYQNHEEVDPKAIALALKKPGNGVIVDDPRGVAIALERKLAKLSNQPVAALPQPLHFQPVKIPPEKELIKILNDAADWSHVALLPQAKARAGRRIVARAQAAEQLLLVKASSKEALTALENRVRQRSLHKHWRFHGLDGAVALRTLILLKAPRALALAQQSLWRDDPDLKRVANPKYKVPRAWTDFRIKIVVFPALAKASGKEAEKLCRDHLSLADDKANEIGPPVFEAAAKALLAISPKMETALELLKHRRGDVRGRAILECLRRFEDVWTEDALKKAAAHALAYVPPQ